jgi:predicted PurR-regulated permease PerM
VTLLVLGGLSSESESISKALSDALDEVEKWLSSLGIEQGSVKPELQKAVSESGSTLIDGISRAISGLAELATFLTLSAFTTFFYLKDGPSIRA